MSQGSEKNSNSRRMVVVLTVCAAVLVAAGVRYAAQAAAPEKARGPASCAPLTGDLQAGPPAAIAALTGVPPNVDAAVSTLGGLTGTVTALASIGCLPSFPPAPDADVTPCLDTAADLVAQLSGALAALLAAAGQLPDVTAALALVKKLVDTVQKLITDKCLPAPPTS
jgi:hypothetical protein